MRDFDEARKARAEQEIGFTMKGENIRVNASIPIHVLDEYENRDVKRMGDLRRAEADLIVACLYSDDDRGKWEKIYADTKDPLTPGDVHAIVDFLYEVSTGVPTIAPVPSTGSGARGSRTSKESTS